jgi:hypothetical protein
METSGQRSSVNKSDEVTLVLGGALFGLIFAVIAWAML